VRACTHACALFLTAGTQVNVSRSLLQKKHENTTTYLLTAAAGALVWPPRAMGVWFASPAAEVAAMLGATGTGGGAAAGTSVAAAGSTLQMALGSMSSTMWKVSRTSLNVLWAPNTPPAGMHVVGACMGRFVCVYVCVRAFIL